MTQGQVEFPPQCNLLTPRTALIGSDGTALQNVNPTELSDGCLCNVVGVGLYQLSKLSVAAINPPLVIATIYGSGVAGRWIQIDTGSSGGGDGLPVLNPFNLVTLATGTPGSFVVRDGTSFPVDFIGYDDTNDTAGFWNIDSFSYGGGDAIVRIFWASESATSGDVVWGVSFGAITAGDAGSMEAKSLAAEITATSACLGTTAKRLTSADVTITGASLDSLAVGDYLDIRVRRIGSSGSDTMAGDANFQFAKVIW